MHPVRATHERRQLHGLFSEPEGERFRSCVVGGEKPSPPDTSNLIPPTFAQSFRYEKSRIWSVSKWCTTVEQMGSPDQRPAAPNRLERQAGGIKDRMLSDTINQRDEHSVGILADDSVDGWISFRTPLRTEATQQISGSDRRRLSAACPQRCLTNSRKRTRVPWIQNASRWSALGPLGSLQWKIPCPYSRRRIPHPRPPSVHQREAYWRRPVSSAKPLDVIKPASETCE